ncbi:hypothetical protein K438DRAFT_1987555 [Mycena galopus ATCC 62051]|nr:hypothetical protein K438DRAFT_1987555 [Mycena galopus ATCC 62051]
MLMVAVVPDAILARILLFSTTPTQSVFLLACRKLAAIAKPALYRSIRVCRDKAPALFLVLATNPELGRLVRLLELRGNPDLPPLMGSSFEAAFTNLQNLKALQLESSVDVRGLMRSFRGRLHEFIYWPQVDDPVMDFLLLQPHIRSIYFHELNLLSCDREFLPRLEFVRARPCDVALLVASRPVRGVRIVYGTHDYEERPVVPLTFIALSTARVIHLELQVSQLLAVQYPGDLTTLLPDVREMVILQDRTWGSRGHPVTNFSDIIVPLVGCISSLLTLEKLAYISTYGLAEALVIQDIMYKCCTAPRLDVLQIFMRRGLVKWSRVRESAEYIYSDQKFVDSFV